MRRSQVAVIVSTALATVLVAGAPGIASGSGIKGEPQPEADAFTIAAAGTLGVVDDAMLPDGNIAAVWAVGNGSRNVEFCLLGRGNDTCTVKTPITPSDLQNVFGTPQVIALSNTDIDVLVEESSEVALYASTDGGHTFASPANLGETVSVGAAEDVDGTLIFSQNSASSDEDYVEAVSTSSPSDPGSYADLFNTGASQTFSAAGLGSYHGGVLAAVTNNTGADDEVQTLYAPSGSDFNSASSYLDKTTFAHESLESLSGDALLTQQTRGKEEILLRVWTGSSWTSPKVVPDYQNSGPGLWSVFQDPSGRVDVISSLAAHGYDIYVTSTTNVGTTWSTPHHLENATSSFGFGVALDRNGTGLLTSSDAHHVHGYPILQTVSVSIHAKHARLKVHKKDTITGTVSPKSVGGLVYLQQEKHGRWYAVAHATQSAAGKYRFTVKRGSPTSLTLRVMSNDRAGYLEYGYSGPTTVTFYKPKHH